MGGLTRTLQRGVDWIWNRSNAAPLERRAASFEDVIRRLDGEWMTGANAGKHVTADTALRVMAVFACVRVLAYGVASAPLNVYRDLGGDQRELAVDDPRHRLLNRAPNRWQTSFDWRAAMMVNASLTGFGLSVKTFAGDGRVLDLLPVATARVRVERTARGRLQFVVTPAPETDDISGTFAEHEVLLIRDLALGAATHIAPVRLAREAIGLAMASEESQALLHLNGGRPSGFLTTDNAMDREQVEQIRDYWRQSYSGSQRHGVAILDMGMKFESMGMKGVDAQHLETRRFQVEEVCRAFNVFPQMVMQSDKTSTYASAEAFFAAHFRHTLAPWLENWEQRLDESILDGAGPLAARFDKRQMVRASAKDRGEFLNKMVQSGIYTRNEARAEEGLPPLPGLDEPLTPVNLTPDGDAMPPPPDDDEEVTP